MTGLFTLIVICIVVWLRSHDKLGRVQAELKTVKNELSELKLELHTIARMVKASSETQPISQENKQIEQPIQFEKISPASPYNESSPKKSKDSTENNVGTILNSNGLPHDKYPSKQPESPKEYVMLYSDSPDFDVSPVRKLNSSTLLWVGAFILALGGVFLAKFAIESGLIAPATRVLLGTVFGISLIVAAEYLVRYPEKFNIQTSEVSAALVAAGIITCYSMSLVASHYYDFLIEPWSFFTLAAISLIATFLALRFGPIVAGIGMVGAYAVPVFFWAQSHGLMQLMLYIGLVSLSAVFVANRVRSDWLWWLSFAGYYLWLFVSLLLLKSTEIWLLLGFCLVSLYIYVFSDVLGWRLERGNRKALPLKTLLMFRKEQVGLIAAIVPIWAYYLLHGYNDTLIGCTLVMVAVLLLSPVKHSAFDSWPFLGLVLTLATQLLQANSNNYNDDLFVFAGMHLYTQVAALAFFAYSAYMQYMLPRRVAYSLLFVCSPAILYGAAYILSPPQANQIMYSLWATELAIFSVVGLYLTKKSVYRIIQMSGWLFANFNLALMFTMLLDSATLTLAFTAQIVAAGYWGQKFQYSTPHWLVKGAVSLIILRLTLSPWIPLYQDETIFGVHWTIIVYPLVFIAFGYAEKWFKQPEIESWFVASRIHIAALFVTTETSYQLVGHYPFLARFTFEECLLLALSWMVLGTVYLYRMHVATHFAKLYEVFSIALFAGSGLLYAQLFTQFNPFLTNKPVGEMFFFNWLTLLWLTPAVITILIVKFGLIEGKPREIVKLVSLVFLVIFVNSMIRHPFHDGRVGFQMGIAQVELYTYSLVWLLVSLGMIVWSQYKSSNFSHRAGFVILALVTAKAFIVDMSQLEGIYRALSFMGLGLCLIGVGWLFQRLKKGSKEAVG